MEKPSSPNRPDLWLSLLHVFSLLMNVGQYFLLAKAKSNFAEQAKLVKGYALLADEYRAILDKHTADLTRLNL